MILSLLLQAAVALPTPTLPKVPPIDTQAMRFDRCVDLATTQADSGAADATAWHLAGGGFLARQCLGLAYTTGGKFEAAAGAFEQAAHEAELAKDGRVANYWAQAGNAWLAASNPAKALAALNAALAAGTLSGLPLGEAHLDRARAQVAANDLVAARADLDKALGDAADDPLAWLLSATLARRTGDLPRAHRDIAEALKRSADDASVQLEAGNIAAASGNEAGAKLAWAEAVKLSPNSQAVIVARDALKQFGPDK